MASPSEDALELRMVCNELSEVVHKTREVGIQLGIPHVKMVMFEREVDPLSSAIEFWLRGNVPHVPTTWTSIVQALKSGHVKENGVAERIFNKYCRQSSVVKDEDHEILDLSPLEPEIEVEVNITHKIRQLYADYVDRILTIVRDRGVSAKHLCSYLINLPDTDDKLLSDLKNLKHTDDVAGVFILLSLNHTSFSNCRIFEKILKRFGGNESHEDLEYPIHLKAYTELHLGNRYSGSYNITRMFLLGNPGAGKSTFKESLKREGFFESFSKVSEFAVPPHTAGIIPSVHVSKQLGRVLFYDFAGYAEYFSSHAAIFDSLAFSRKGDNIFIIVVDLREDSATIRTTLHYWFSFIQYQKFSRSYFIVVGSHQDQSIEQSRCLDQFCTAMQPEICNIKHFILDCRNPRSNQIAQLKKQILAWVSESQKCTLSQGARLLLGGLEKDFSSITACPVQTIVEHFKDFGDWLPIKVNHALLQLHEMGFLLLLGDDNKDGGYVILNILKFTNEVHSAIFSSNNVETFSAFNIGVLPQSVLQELLPSYITKECLMYLQYCQQISRNDVRLFPSLDKEDQSILFFPALCNVDKSQVSWDESSSKNFSIGWLALCIEPHDYFTPRFLHVLLLRLVYNFTLSVPAKFQIARSSLEHSRRCTMWKNGVHWLMQEGVDCTVEMVNRAKGVVVLTKSSLDGAENCIRVFTDIVRCVMEAKAEFCFSIKPNFFLLDSSAEADCLNENHQFAMSDVERALGKPEGKRVIISVSGRGLLDISKVLYMRRLTSWSNLFPISYYEVLHTLKQAVHKIFVLGVCLGAPRAFLESLEIDFPSDVSRKSEELVKWWMNSSPEQPCWYTLVQALKHAEMNYLAEDVQEKHDAHIQLQEKLLCKETQALKPDEEFLHSLSGVVGFRWPSLAVSLELCHWEIEELQGKVGLSQQELALQMLKIWASREEATYGQLCRKLKTIPIFQN